jgi:hypothetical protein
MSKELQITITVEVPVPDDADADNVSPHYTIAVGKIRSALETLGLMWDIDYVYLVSDDPLSDPEELL